MPERFLCSDPQAGDFEFADVESILDALEAGLVSSDTPLFDASRQSWHSVGLHPEVRSAWEERQRFRPPGSSPLALPALPAPAVVEVGDLTLRRQAYARVRAGSRQERAEEPPAPKRSIVALALVFGLMTLALVGWAVVALAVRLSAFAGGLFAVSSKR
jgi:hypothetical protein